LHTPPFQLGLLCELLVGMVHSKKKARPCESGLCDGSVTVTGLWQD
jgi:hypothetical protein